MNHIGISEEQKILGPESEAEWYPNCLHATVASLMSHPDA